MSEKKQAAKEISALIESFGGEHLNDELTGYALKLCDTLSRKRKLNIARGRKEIWAAAVIYQIARLNFLFDKANPLFLTADTIYSFFGTKKTTTSNKANLIEEACALGLGEPGLCTDEIVAAFSFLQLPNGLIVPESMIDAISFEVADEEEAKEIEAFLAEKQRQEEAALKAQREGRAEINRQTAEKEKRAKQEEERSRQPGLFDD